MKTALRAAGIFLLLLLVLAAAFYLDPIPFTRVYQSYQLWSQGVNSRYTQVDGYEVHYFEAGPADGVPLILIHGLGGRGEDWEPLIPSFTASGFHVYVPDLLGFGRSDEPDVDYSISLQENLVVHLMQTLGISKASVGGWSMGGWVAAKLAIDHPQLVDRLFLYDSVGIYFPTTFDADLFSPTDRAGLDRLFARLQPMPEELPDFAVRAALRTLKEKAWVVNRSMAAMSSGRDLLDFSLWQISRPTLIVWGSADNLVPLNVGQSMHRLIPDSSFTVIEGCGHLAPVQCTAPVLSTTLQFLKSQPPQKNLEQTLPGQ